MQRRERRPAKAERRAVRTLSDLDYLLGVSDVSRAGVLRLASDGQYVATSTAVPPLVQLVLSALRQWRKVARAASASAKECDRMASAFL